MTYGKFFILKGDISHQDYMADLAIFTDIRDQSSVKTKPHPMD